MSSVLFLCTGNACRSQMAEGWLRKLHPDIDAYSAGIVAHGKNPLAIRAMQQVGIDISDQQSQSIDELPVEKVDYVFTVCANAAENCPYFPASIKLQHVPFADPPQLAKQTTNDEQALVFYAQVRDQIRDFVANIKQYMD